MFGYHDSDRCYFDLWSPADPRHCAIENRAFSPYMKHEQEKEDIINAICSGAKTISFDDDFSDKELKEIENEVFRRIGMICSLI